MNATFSMRSSWVFHNALEQERKNLMRIKVALGIWLLGVALAWMAVAPPDLGLSPMIDTRGVPIGWWQLRQHAIYLSGLWSISLMVLVMLLALRLPLFDRLLGGMDQVYLSLIHI